MIKVQFVKSGVPYGFGYSQGDIGSIAEDRLEELLQNEVVKQLEYVEGATDVKPEGETDVKPEGEVTKVTPDSELNATIESLSKKGKIK